MVKLKRTISWKMLTLYGLGNILGAGIYVLIGEVAKESGDAILWSFIGAGIVASFTAITYGAMASEYPVSAGAAIYTERAFKSKSWSTLIGLAMALTAIVSASALLNGFNNYFQVLLDTLGVSFNVPSFVVILSLLALLAIFALRGIGDSTKLAVLLTLIETGGLLLIISFAFLYGDPASAISTSLSSIGSVTPLAILLGAFVAFYAFIGFEDMVNVAEEVKQPKKQIKRGMLTALTIAVILYILTVLAALAVLTSAELANSTAPLATVWQTVTNSDVPIITIIGIIAITNGALIGIITASRIIYGLAREGWITKKLAKISPKSNTPVRATYLVVGIIALAAVALPLGTLAQITSFVLLIVFTIVQFSALKLKRQNKLPTLKYYVPILGLFANFGVMTIQILSWLSIV
jgi:amino acid transporter